MKRSKTQTLPSWQGFTLEEPQIKLIGGDGTNNGGSDGSTGTDPQPDPPLA